MEIKSLVIKLKYGPVDFLLDTLTPGLAVFLNIRISQAGFCQLKQTNNPPGRLGLSLLISVCIVFGLVFLYEIIDACITGRNRKVRMDRCRDSFLISFGCRFHYFRKNDVKGFNFDEKRKKLTVILTRCIEKRRGIYSYIRLFRGTDTQHEEKSVAEYISPLTAGGPDLLRFGEPDNDHGVLFNPFIWTPVTHVQMIERDSDFEFSIPCQDKTAAWKIISEIIGYKGFVFLPGICRILKRPHRTAAMKGRKRMEKKKGCGFVSVCFILSIGIFFGLTTWIMLQAR